jgi:voltage-gated potassium channel
MNRTSPSRSHGLIRSEKDREKVLLKANIILLVALSVMIFISPVLPKQDHILTRVLLCILVGSGLFAAEFNKAAFRILSAIGALVILVTLLNLILHESNNLSILTFFLNTLFFIIVTIALVAHVAKAKDVDGSTLLCAINSYLLIGLTLSIMFMIMDLFFPGSFEQVDTGTGKFSTFVYYGFITLTTLGYGDITPSTAMARSLSAFTALFGQLYLVIIMALIIGKFLITKKAEE